MEKAWLLKDVDQHYCHHTLRRATEGAPFADEKNPARAYTFSLFFWGAGQSYSGHRMKSVLFQIFMVAFLIGIVFSLLYGKELLALLQEQAISHAEVFLSVEFLLLASLLFWKYNAADAYHAAAKARRIPFRGVQSRALPTLCSFLIPGWGQFMNGQPLKGTLLAGFSVLGIFSLITIPLVLLCWPSLEESRARAIIEVIFAVTVLYLPLIPLVSILSSYDALKVSLDDMKKESIVDRIMFAINRARSRGWVSIFFPSKKSIAMIAIFFGLIIIFKNSHQVPANLIAGHLAEAHAWLHKQGMTVVPDLITRLVTGPVLAGK